MIRHRPIQGESNIDFLGESEGSLPPPPDSLPDAGEAIIDFGPMTGNFIYRHHVEPRVKLKSPREKSYVGRAPGRSCKDESVSCAVFPDQLSSVVLMIAA